MHEIAEHGIGVVVLSWWGRPDQHGAHDTQGVRTDDAIALVLDCALEHEVEVALHLEPYPGACIPSRRLDRSRRCQRAS